ncbi:c-type cytochrome [Chitinophaga sp. 22321]|uniref:C-type cytochrome n=1 Tax=Chitinophaga hostae TaxID=2831022 RepID=A0ABS5J820_9BACT|nr:c-type cytochrome [Chitinophaga hostae]MBS0031225.1 c-type cytochrome [Chitinophaga hostae]
MKRLAIPVMLLLTMSTTYAQTKPGAGAKKTSPKTVAKPKAAPAIKKEDVDEGKVLLTKSDCLACHKVDTKVVGPAYADVAKKYPYSTANVDLLSTKIINGGSGTWGAVPMAAHPALAAADVKKMVTYILSLNAK